MDSLRIGVLLLCAVGALAQCPNGDCQGGGYGAQSAGAGAHQLGAQQQGAQFGASAEKKGVQFSAQFSSRAQGAAAGNDQYQKGYKDGYLEGLQAQGGGAGINKVSAKIQGGQFSARGQGTGFGGQSTRQHSQQQGSGFTSQFSTGQGGQTTGGQNIGFGGQSGQKSQQQSSGFTSQFSGSGARQHGQAAGGNVNQVTRFSETRTTSQQLGGGNLASSGAQQRQASITSGSVSGGQNLQALGTNRVVDLTGSGGSRNQVSSSFSRSSSTGIGAVPRASNIRLSTSSTRQVVPASGQSVNFQRSTSGNRAFSNTRSASRSSSSFASAGLPGFGRGEIDVNNFGNIDASAFGFDNFGNQYINVEAFDFNGWRNAAANEAPKEALTGAQQEQIVIGSRFRSGYARQQESSSSEKSGSGSGEAGIELSASRQASQDATQQYTQTASGEGNTEQGAAYGYQRTPNLQFQAVELESLPVHSGPRSQLPTTAQRRTQPLVRTQSRSRSQSRISAPVLGNDPLWQN